MNDKFTIIKCNDGIVILDSESNIISIDEFKKLITKQDLIDYYRYLEQEYNLF